VSYSSNQFAQELLMKTAFIKFRSVWANSYQDVKHFTDVFGWELFVLD